MPLTSKAGSLGQLSVGPSELVPASAGWEHRVMSAMGTADPAPASAMLEAPPWMLHNVSDRTSTEHPNRSGSLDRMDTQELKGVFSTGSSRQEVSPARAARHAQTISAALVAEMEVSGRYASLTRQCACIESRLPQTAPCLLHVHRMSFIPSWPGSVIIPCHERVVHGLQLCHAGHPRVAARLQSPAWCS